MNNIDNFKQFAKNNKELANYIKDGTMTWQKFYELYDMYGEDSDIWSQFKEESKKKSTSLTEIVNLAKNIDLDKLQEGVNSISKAITLFNDLIASKSKTPEQVYKPRAIYKRFED